MKNIKWENGLKLDSNLLSLSDLFNARNSNLSNFLPFNLSKGVITFDLEKESLNDGLIFIKKLVIYLENKKPIIFDGSYPLSLQILSNNGIADVMDIYININEKIVEEDGVKCTEEVLSLSTEYDYSANHSSKIASFRINNTILEVIDSDMPILTMNHYMMDSIFQRLNKLIAIIDNFNKFIFSSSRPSISPQLNFLLLKLVRELNFAEFNKSSTSPYDIFNLLHDIYNLLILSDFQTKIDTSSCVLYEFNKAYSKFNQLIDLIEKTCEQKNIRNFVQFENEGQKYICNQLPQEFLTANKYYFVIKKKLDNEERGKPIKEIKITSISRYTNSIVLSLPGLKLREVDRSMHHNLHISLGEGDYLFEIMSNSEWDFVLVDKSAVFSTFKGAENYDFFIAFV